MAQNPDLISWVFAADFGSGRVGIGGARSIGPREELEIPVDEEVIWELLLPCMKGEAAEIFDTAMVGDFGFRPNIV